MCRENGVCSNFAGHFICECNDGYEMNRNSCDGKSMCRSETSESKNKKSIRQTVKFNSSPVLEPLATYQTSFYIHRLIHYISISCCCTTLTLGWIIGLYTIYEVKQKEYPHTYKYAFHPLQVTFGRDLSSARYWVSWLVMHITQIGTRNVYLPSIQCDNMVIAKLMTNTDVLRCMAGLLLHA